ncbi:MAG TPA: hypothetical protein VIG40_06860 [Tissierellaceae bacterium]
MKNKLTMIFLVMILILSFSSSVFASDKYEILNPEKSAFSTKNKVVLVNGKAPTDTKVILDLYGTTDLTRKNFNLANLPKEEEFIKRATEEIKSGNMGFFKKEVDLILGINKIVVKFDKTDVAKEIIIYVYDKSTLPTESTLIDLKSL